MQQTLGFEDMYTRGGWRPGSGRKRNKQTMSHGVREFGYKSDPLLITWKRRPGLKGFRRVTEARVIFNAIRAAKRGGFRVIHFSIQTNHIHLLIEADSADSLARGMKGLGCRVAKGLNKLWRRKGKLFLERFHSHILRTPAELYHGLRYVLNNHLKHGCHSSRFGPDIYSSGDSFDGWLDHQPTDDPTRPRSYVSPPGFKLAVLWKRHHPPISLHAVPGH